MIIRRIYQVVIDFIYNSSAYGVTRELRQQRAELENLFMLLVLGEGLGVPVLPVYYAHQLWPYVLPRLASWKRILLRPRGLGNW